VYYISLSSFLCIFNCMTYVLPSGEINDNNNDNSCQNANTPTPFSVSTFIKKFLCSQIFFDGGGGD